mmetsp:Transcript_79352/g.220776  ORF Transcript_79352/g.220776 Transcript_79352/m.220776 type:complete len:254 (+) Transcript_79352:2825-3586(+)
MYQRCSLRRVLGREPEGQVHLEDPTEDVTTHANLVAVGLCQRMEQCFQKGLPVPQHGQLAVLRSWAQQVESRDGSHRPRPCFQQSAHSRRACRVPLRRRLRRRAIQQKEQDHRVAVVPHHRHVSSIKTIVFTTVSWMPIARIIQRRPPRAVLTTGVPANVQKGPSAVQRSEVGRMMQGRLPVRSQLSDLQRPVWWHKQQAPKPLHVVQRGCLMNLGTPGDSVAFVEQGSVMVTAFLDVTMRPQLPHCVGGFQQ